LSQALANEFDSYQENGSPSLIEAGSSANWICCKVSHGVYFECTCQMFPQMICVNLAPHSTPICRWTGSRC
jgi:hypothetical protein